MFENRLLRGIFCPKRDEITGGQRKRHNEKLHKLYSLLNINGVQSSRMRWEGNAAHTEEKETE
jgi:hypothetical protein